MIWLLLIIGVLICISSYALAVCGTIVIANRQLEAKLIPISYIYVDNNYDIFVVTDENGKTYTGKTNKIYKSNNDFLIQYNKNVSDAESFLYGTKKCKYELFLKDTNVPNK